MNERQSRTFKGCSSFTLRIRGLVIKDYMKALANDLLLHQKYYLLSKWSYSDHETFNHFLPNLKSRKRNETFVNAFSL
jgi:hypothetical protein